MIALGPRLVIAAAPPEAPLGGHLWHIVLLAAWPPIFGAFVVVERMKARRRGRVPSVADAAACGRTPSATVGRAQVPGSPTAAPEVKPRTAAWRPAMALASVCAALIHLAVMPSHFEQSLWYGVFFLIAASTQIAFAVAVLARPSRRLVAAGLAGSIGVVVLWFLTRTVGVPIGPDNGATEPFGLLDILATVAEAAAGIFGCLALRSWDQRPRWRWSLWPYSLRLAAPACILATVVASVLGSRS